MAGLTRAHGHFVPDMSDPPFACPPDKLIEHWCRRCGTRFHSPHPRHFYCDPCNQSLELNQKREQLRQVGVARRRDAARDTGKAISTQHEVSLADPRYDPLLKWLVKISVPFSWDASKNAIYSIRGNRRGKGRQLALRAESRDYRNNLIAVLQRALAGRKIVQNKLWIDIFVEKSDHRGDAVNVIDTVCDAIKVAADLDDRWFCIRHLDWSISKNDPHIIIGIGQEDIEPVQACSYCGRLLAFEQFSLNRTNKNGRVRVCRDCSKKPAA